MINNDIKSDFDEDNVLTKEALAKYVLIDVYEYNNRNLFDMFLDIVFWLPETENQLYNIYQIARNQYNFLLTIANDIYKIPLYNPQAIPLLIKDFYKYLEEDYDYYDFIRTYSKPKEELKVLFINMIFFNLVTTIDMIDKVFDEMSNYTGTDLNEATNLFTPKVKECTLQIETLKKYLSFAKIAFGDMSELEISMWKLMLNCNYKQIKNKKYITDYNTTISLNTIKQIQDIDEKVEKTFTYKNLTVNLLEELLEGCSIDYIKDFIIKLDKLCFLRTISVANYKVKAQIEPIQLIIKEYRLKHNI